MKTNSVGLLTILMSSLPYSLKAQDAAPIDENEDEPAIIRHYNSPDLINPLVLMEPLQINPENPSFYSNGIMRPLTLMTLLETDGREEGAIDGALSDKEEGDGPIPEHDSERLTFAHGWGLFDRDYDSSLIRLSTDINQNTNYIDYIFEFGYNSSKIETEDDTMSIGIFELEGEEGTEKYNLFLTYGEVLLGHEFFRHDLNWAFNLYLLADGVIDVEVKRFRLDDTRDELPRAIDFDFYTGPGLRLTMDFMPFAWSDAEFIEGLGFGVEGDVNFLMDVGDLDNGIDNYYRLFFTGSYTLE